jgi:PAS domain S-box-containing protein
MSALTAAVALAALVVNVVLMQRLVVTRRRLRREEPFRAMTDGAPAMMRVAGLDGASIHLNRGWLDFTGRRREDDLGSGWINSVHPDDRKRVHDTYKHAFDEMEPFGLEYRLRRWDGEYRWVADSCVPWRTAAGSLAGYIASALDISDRKRAEDTLRDLSGRLIAAQEEERRRIARELHDDLSQRLALLSVEIEHLGLYRSQPGSEERWRALSSAAAEIATDLHHIAHRLHPSRLEALGLVTAISGFCQELWSQHRLQVRFTHEGVPHAIPGDVALCLYRIVQEALQNVIKHSGVMEAEVHLAASGDGGLLLRVSDPGGGFAAGNRDNVGLGLLSMRERVHSLGGELVVHTSPGRGTRISARVGLQPTVGEKQPA